MTTTIAAIRTVLQADTALVALVGAKIYANRAPQGTLAPYVVLQVISDVPENALTGAVSERLANYRLQVDTYGRTYLEAKGVAEAINGIVAALSSPDLAAVRIGGRDLFDNETQLHRDSMDFSVWR